MGSQVAVEIIADGLNLDLNSGQIKTVVFDTHQGWPVDILLETDRDEARLIGSGPDSVKQG